MIMMGKSIRQIWVKNRVFRVRPNMIENEKEASIVIIFVSVFDLEFLMLIASLIVSVLSSST